MVIGFTVIRRVSFTIIALLFRLQPSTTVGHTAPAAQLALLQSLGCYTYSVSYTVNNYTLNLQVKTLYFHIQALPKNYIGKLPVADEVALIIIGNT